MSFLKGKSHSNFAVSFIKIENFWRPGKNIVTLCLALKQALSRDDSCIGLGNGLKGQ
jgi:hypothetical protein